MEQKLFLIGNKTKKSLGSKAAACFKTYFLVAEKNKVTLAEGNPIKEI